MKVKIIEVDSGQLIGAEIREGDKKELPSLADGWSFNFNKHILSKGKRAFVLVKEDSQTVIEGCMIFSNHETFGPFMDYLEVAPHNLGSKGKYKGVAGCLIAYACGLSLYEGDSPDKGFLTFEAFSEDENAQNRLEKMYRIKYKAIMNPMGYMEIHPDVSKELVKEYLNDENE